jgi:uncharacterized protein (DUF2252 family)
MAIIEATRSYERWMAQRIKIVAADLKRKHAMMTSGAFPFLRATFYRWVELWKEACPDLASAPAVLAVGDLHVENFGTWRDAEGRLVWGTNDFDEAFPMPYTNDLLRLATSALLAIKDQSLSIGPEFACRTILDGYEKAIEVGGRPFVLEESQPALRTMALGAERDPVRFWAKLDKLKTVPASKNVRRLLRAHFPDAALEIRIAHRIAGIGSLGRQRYLGLSQWDGGMVAREAKAALPSAAVWAANRRNEKLYYDKILKHSVRASDPFVAIDNGWILRRLAPHCSRIDISDFPRRRDERLILWAMGFEMANIHLGTRPAIASIRRELRRRQKNWLHDAASVMAGVTLKEWKLWRNAHQRS